MTKKELMEAIKDLPDDAKVEFYSYEILRGFAKVRRAEYNEELHKITLD